jgi:nitrate reductase cytochrome c-type subunit
VFVRIKHLILVSVNLFDSGGIMKTLIRLTLGCTIAALVLAFLPACDQEQAPVPKVAAKPSAPVKPEIPADTGLVPDQASTGNPPMIPHEVEESDGGEECLGCHKDGEDAPKIPDWHATLTDCRQCHVPATESTAIFKTQY